MRKIYTVILALLFMNLASYAQEDTTATDDFDMFDMDLESLMDMEVTTASKKAQSIDEAPAAVTVITKEDLRFYGANNLGEALRLVPGMEIIQGGDNNYEVSVRGFSRTGYNTSNKVLWLVDGRSAYYDGLGGFRMETCPIAINDIERIEVIRGSGSALYGANAFSGIVNIITKKNKEDGVHGSVSAAYGNLNQLNTMANVNGRKDKLSYKITLGYDNIDQVESRFEGLSDTEKDSLGDYGYLEGSNSLMTRIYGNMAVQYDLDENRNIRFAGGFSDAKKDYYYIVPGEVPSLDFFAQLDYTDEKNSFRAFYNSNPRFEYKQNKFMYATDATDPYMQLMNRELITNHPEPTVITRTMDYEYQRNIEFGDKLSAIAGASYRANFMNSAVFTTEDVEEYPNYNQNIFAGFAQIDYKPIEKLNISLGGRWDNHTTVGNNVNPKLAAVYKASDKHILRAGWGTATRNPHFFDNYLDIYYQGKRFQDLGVSFDPIYNLGYSTPNIIFNVKGNTDLKPEKISSFELGYIFNVNEKLQVKVDGFYNIMKNAIEFGSTSTIDAFIGAVSSLENIHAINPGFATDLSGLAPLNGGVDPSIPNQMTQSEMNDQIAELTNIATALEGMGDPYGNVAALQQLIGGLQQVSAVYNYNLPRIMELPIINSDEEYESYGAELGFTFIPFSGLTITGNYSYLAFSDNYNQSKYEHAVNGVTTGMTNMDTVLNYIRSSEHKFNLGIKYKWKGLYAGVMFSYMSEIQMAADNNRNGAYDTEDISLYDNGGLFTIDPRMNLNINLGYQIKNFDIFVTGYNLIQSDYKQFYFTSTIAGGDYLNTRFMGGLRYNF